MGFVVGLLATHRCFTPTNRAYDSVPNQLELAIHERQSDTIVHAAGVAIANAADFRCACLPPMMTVYF